MTNDKLIEAARVITTDVKEAYIYPFPEGFGHVVVRIDHMEALIEAVDEIPVKF